MKGPCECDEGLMRHWAGGGGLWGGRRGTQTAL